jgi:alcohol dehydrogenase class IV
LGGYYDLPHGICNAVLLPQVSRFNLIQKDACGLTNPRCPSLDDVIGIYKNAL